jgi:ParB family chromosome partitioning protein
MSLLNVGHDSNCIGIRASAPALEGFTKVADDSTAHKVMLEMGAVWGEKLPAEGESKYSGLDSDEVRSWCIAQTQSVLLNLLAFLTALSIDAVVAKNKQTATGSADHLARVLKLDMHTHWTPSVEGFFGRLSKAQMEAALKEAGVKLDISKDKKAEAAAKVHKALAGKAWLPEVLRFAS